MTTVKTIVQCDFDGTVTVEDISFILLDAFAEGDWRQTLQDYRDGRISVGGFNARAFGLVKASRESLLDFLTCRASFRVRQGFPELVRYCADNGVKFVIVSNGLDFYIRAVLRGIGLDGLDVFAAENRFSPQGMKVRYVGPDGNHMDDSFKEAYTRLFLEDGYRVVYIGNGLSDIHPAKHAQQIFAIDDLLKGCRAAGIDCTPFQDFSEVVQGLDKLLRD
ncbi:MAG: HAD-IB family phosphatase [Chloroflexi bacterium]|nr:HAD-IB family phosphatase [Chloroflexota bacterium]